MKRNWKGLKRFGHQALRTHLMRVAKNARQRHGSLEGPGSLEAFLEDRDCVRFAVEIVFSDDLPDGLFADSEAIDDDGAPRRFRLRVHPKFSNRRDVLPALIAYHIPSINYGRMVTAEDAECFGAALLGWSRDEYYRRLCQWADETGSAAR